MKMSENSQQTFFPAMELPLMLSPEGSRAKTSALPESKPGLAREPVLASGPKSSDLLASYDRATSSWRTSQTCLLALLKNEAGGLAEYSETWPNAGMMRNGEIFPQPLWDWTKPVSEYGLLPTVTKSDGTPQGNILTPSMVYRSDSRGLPRRQSRGGQMWSAGFARLWAIVMGEEVPPEAAEKHMGFPTGWTDLQP